jgi:hypothetical protein
MNLFLHANRPDDNKRATPQQADDRVVRNAQLAGGPHTTRHAYASYGQPHLSLLAKVLAHAQTYVTHL